MERPWLSRPVGGETTEICILASIGVPVTTNGPSQSSLQWSEDGQAFVVTRGAVYILVRTMLSFDMTKKLMGYFH